MQTCPKCQTAHDDGKKFCQGCGTALTGGGTPPPRPPLPVKKIATIAGLVLTLLLGAGAAAYFFHFRAAWEVEDILAKKRMTKNCVWDIGSDQQKSPKIMNEVIACEGKLECLLALMKKHGASAQAIAFTKMMEGDYYATSYAKVGDLAAITIAPMHFSRIEEFVIIANGSPPNLDAMQLIENKVEAQATAEARRRFSIPEPFVHAPRYIQGQVVDGKAKFRFCSPVGNQCRGCEIICSIVYEFTFDERGVFQGVTVAEIVEGSPYL